MATVVGIAFRRAARHYWFDPADIDLQIGDRVVVETARGMEIGTVRAPIQSLDDARLNAPLKRVLRKAGASDDHQEAANAQRAENTLQTAAQRVRAHNLPMRLLSAEHAFDGSQVTIYFMAENRVDFRELVKDLASQLRCRVQLYQIGARDHARMVGGIGTCGRELCCARFMAEFAPISMRMAKDQSLFLNPAKFSGVCGKLMCCLRYEHEVYTEGRKLLPPIGARVRTPRGFGRVAGLCVIRGEVTVALDESGADVAFGAADVTVLSASGSSAAQSAADEPDDQDPAGA